MEIVLQWLDDLDDAVFAAVLAWERLRGRCIEIGAVSGAGFAASAIVAADWMLPLAAVAGFSISAAVLGGALAALADAVSESRRGARRGVDV
jgi:hypothetical protein